MPEITWSQFEAVEMRAGTIVGVDDFRRRASRPTSSPWTSVRGLGIRRTSAQVKTLYAQDELVGRQVMGVVNFPPKQIGPLMSEFLLVGFYREDGARGAGGAGTSGPERRVAYSVFEIAVQNRSTRLPAANL